MAAASAPGPVELHCDDPKGIVKFHYNPETVTLNKSVTWQPAQTTAPEGSAVHAQFTNQPPMTLSFDMFLDKWKGTAASGGHAPTNVIKQLIEWAKPIAKAKGKKPQPPILFFHWGKQKLVPDVKWYITSLRMTLMMFDSHGEITRAKVAVSLQEFTAPKGKGNPTSGGPPGRRALVIGLGDTLESIAYSEFGRPGLWRALATVNGIDDPKRVGAGTTILIPPLAECERLA